MAGDPADLAAQIDAAGFQDLPIWPRHAQMVANLPLHHSDPFDRLLVAQALSEPLHLLTADAQLKPYTHLVLCI